MKKKALVLVAALVLLGSGCSSRIKLGEFPEFIRFAGPAAPVKPQNVRPPLIFVPGIQGTFLTDGSGAVRWGTSSREAFLDRFAMLSLDLESQGYRDENDGALARWIDFYNRRGIQEGQVLAEYSVGFSRKIRLLSVPIYKVLRENLIDVAGYREGADLFPLPYDWRLDNRVAAVKLALLLDTWSADYLAYVKKQACGDTDVKCDNYEMALVSLYNRGYLNDRRQVRFNIVAHSMGGLVSRYFMEVLDSDSRINQLIVFGTPNRGSMKMLKYFSEGVEPNALFKFYQTVETRPIVFTFPSGYQLLPRYGSLFLPEDASFRAEQDLLLTQYTVDPMTPGLFDRAAKNWYRYSLVPCESREEETFSICKSMPRKEIVRQALRDNLESSHKFLLALNDPADADWDFECGLVRASEKFLRAINRQKTTFSAKNMGDACRSAETGKDTALSEMNRKLTIFGGFGGETLAKAALVTSPVGTGQFLLDFDVDCDNCSGKKSLGDGTVPLQSIKFRPEGYVEDNGSFYMYETHVDLVKNETFVYNVMRRLLDLE